MRILFREGNVATLPQPQLQVLANANAEDSLTLKQRTEYTNYISYLDGIGDTAPPPPQPKELGYQVIENFTYRANGESVTGGYAHLYDNQIIIYDSEGKRDAISSVSDYGGGDRYLTVYNGDAVVYEGDSGRIQGMPNSGSVSQNDIDAEQGHGAAIDE